MKLKLTKKKLKHLSKTHRSLPTEQTPNVAGGYTTRPWTFYCEELTVAC